jgi:hypothetical protein
MRLVLPMLLVLASPSAFAQPPLGEEPPGYYAKVLPPPTRTTFLSTTEKRWDVRIGDAAVCTTPCAIDVPPLQFVTLHSHDIRPTKLRVGYLPQGDVLVTAKPRATGPFATGVTFTALGGMALVTGITLYAVGAGTDRDGMRSAGLITGLGGAAVTALGIHLIRISLPTVHVGPGRAQPYVTAGQVGLTGSF